MTIKSLRDIMFENYYKQLRFTKEDGCHSLEKQRKKRLVIFATKLTENTR